MSDAMTVRHTARSESRPSAYAPPTNCVDCGQPLRLRWNRNIASDGSAEVESGYEWVHAIAPEKRR